MTPKLILLGAFTCCALLASSAKAAPDESAPKCPIGLEHLDLRYNHAGGQSRPQLRIAFTNHTDKTITDFVFALSILDSDGNPRPYDSNLTYHRDVAAGNQLQSHIWNLDSNSVDISRSGERVTLLEARFADGTTWKDDGSLACTLLVDYHAK